jgi:hypothetical protein
MTNLTQVSCLASPIMVTNGGGGVAIQTRGHAIDVENTAVRLSYTCAT